MNLNNIFIVGLMGSGKTSIGKLLAKRTGRLFIDTDNEIIKELDMTITEIFNKFDEKWSDHGLAGTQCDQIGTCSFLLLLCGHVQFWPDFKAGYPAKVSCHISFLDRWKA